MKDCNVQSDFGDVVSGFRRRETFTTLADYQASLREAQRRSQGGKVEAAKDPVRTGLLPSATRIRVGPFTATTQGVVPETIPRSTLGHPPSDSTSNGSGDDGAVIREEEGVDAPLRIALNHLGIRWRVEESGAGSQAALNAAAAVDFEGRFRATVHPDERFAQLDTRVENETQSALPLTDSGFRASVGDGAGSGETSAGAGTSPEKSPGGTFRKRFYAVFKGLVPGVYDNWGVASLQVSGYPHSSYQGFATRHEAVDAMRAAGISFDEPGVDDDDDTAGEG